MKTRSALMLFSLSLLVLASCSRDDSIPGGSGFVEATEVVVSAEVTGRLEKLYYDEGQKINSGDVIALIDTTNLTLQMDKAQAGRDAAETRRQTAQLQIDKAAADYDLVKKEFDRIASLLKSGSANQQQFDQAENRLQQAELNKKSAKTVLLAAEADLNGIEAEIALLKKQISDCRPLAPTSGTVVTTYIERGELMVAGKSLVKITRLDSVWVKVYLPPNDLTQIKLGDETRIDPEDGQTDPLTGYVSWISPEAEFTPKNVQTREARADLVYAVKITIPNKDEILKIGMPVVVRIP